MTFLKGVICEEEECKRYELLTEECLEIHKLVYHRDQQFEEGHRRCRKKNKLNFRTLMERNIFEEPKYRDVKGKEYPNI